MVEHRDIICMDVAQRRPVAPIHDRRAVIVARTAHHRPHRTHRRIRTRPARYRAIVPMHSLVALVALQEQRIAVHAICSPV